MRRGEALGGCEGRRLTRSAAPGHVGSRSSGEIYILYPMRGSTVRDFIVMHGFINLVMRDYRYSIVHYM